MSDTLDNPFFPTSDDPGRPSAWDPASLSTASDAPAMHAGESIGRYRLVERLGEGGFGVVWRAEQLEPVRRSVAIKLIKPGMDSKAVLTRFEAERQSLAVMDHPCIARVFDGGATERGYPYFVMELVRGEPITTFCDRQRLTIRQRIELFIRVCEAVQHAHMKGVVHRDLKPANVLVSMSAEARPEPKVIDFGIAKALSDRATTDRSILTQQGQLIGTPAYMSPEQADPSGLDIDTRTDVYALGVMLYEILTGTLPFDRRKLREAPMLELKRMILQVDPPKPSTRIGTLSGADAAAGEVDISLITDARRVEPRTLRTLLRQDLDWVVMKCMEKERARRYATPAEIAAELERFLRHEPVLAGPPSASYRLSKLIRRHSLAFTLGGAMALVLCVSTITSAAFAVHAQHQRHLARTAQQSAELAATMEREQREIARDAQAAAEQATMAERTRADELDRVARFQASLIAGLHPDVMGRQLVRRIAVESEAAMRRRGQTDTAHQLAELDRLLSGINATNVASSVLDQFVLTRAQNAINEEFAAQPLVRARLLETVANALEDLGLGDRALSVYDDVLALRSREQGPDHPDTLATRSNIANVLAENGRIDDALEMQEQAYKGLRAQRGVDDELTLTAMINLAAVYRNASRFEDSLRIYEEAVPLHEKIYGPEHEQTLLIENNLGVLYNSLGRIEEGIAIQQKVFDIRERTLGPDHVETLRSCGNLGRAYENAGELDKAIALYQRALKGLRAQIGDEHPETLSQLNNLAVALYTVGRFDEAVDCAGEALEASRRLLGNDHPDTLLAVGNLGAMLDAQGRQEEALPFYRESLEARTRLLGPRDPDRLTALSNMSYLLESLGRLDEALELGQEALRIRREVIGNEQVDTIASMSNVGAILRELNRLDEAEALGAEAVATARRVLPEGHWVTGAMLVQHALTLSAMERYDEALPELEAARALFVASLGEDHPRVAKVDQAIAQAHAALKD